MCRKHPITVRFCVKASVDTHVAQSNRASVYEIEGWEFDPLQGCQFNVIDIVMFF